MIGSQFFAQLQNVRLTVPIFIRQMAYTQRYLDQLGMPSDFANQARLEGGLKYPENRFRIFDHR
jgi:hypothetical protein